MLCQMMSILRQAQHERNMPSTSLSLSNKNWFLEDSDILDDDDDDCPLILHQKSSMHSMLMAQGRGGYKNKSIK